MKLIGLTSLKMQMERITENAGIYKLGGVKIPHIMLNLSHGNGQSIVADYITKILYENDLQNFFGLDMLLEYSLDGSLGQIKKVFEEIDNSAVYANEYEGVVAIDISALSEHINEYQVDYFIDRISNVAQHATVIIYYADKLGKKMESIKQRVGNALGSFIDIIESPYSLDDYTEIIMHDIKERGIKIGSEKKFKSIINRIIDENQVLNAKQAVALADEMIINADYSKHIPTIFPDKLLQYFETLPKKVRRY